MQGIRIIGVDPGYAIVGWGIVDSTGNSLRPVDYGAILTDAGTPFEERLEIIFERLSDIIKTHKPQSMGVEKLYFTKNQTTGIDVAQARGVIMLCARQSAMTIGEYTPLQVKQSVTGYGKADKNQVMQMTRMLLSLPALPKPDDVADALAVAICHAHSLGPRSALR